MKIVAILESDIGTGGGFGQSLSSILQMKKICEDQFEFEVLTTCRENGKQLERLGIPCQLLRIRLWDVLVERARCLGVVPDEKIETLYAGLSRHADAHLFRTNQPPPLEAWLARPPLIYSWHPAGQVADAAILIEPDDTVLLADGMRQCLDEDVSFPWPRTATQARRA